jgi:hypothetical protein
MSFMFYGRRPPPTWENYSYGTFLKCHRRLITSVFEESGPIYYGQLSPTAGQVAEWKALRQVDGTTVASKCTSATNEITGGFSARSESAFGDNPARDSGTGIFECRRPHGTVYGIERNDDGTVRLLVETFDWAVPAGDNIILSRPQECGRAYLPAKTLIPVLTGSQPGEYNNTQDYGPKTSAARNGRAWVVCRAKTKGGVDINDLSVGEGALVVNPVDWCGIFHHSVYTTGSTLRPDYALNGLGVKNWSDAGLVVHWRFDSISWLYELYGFENMKLYREAEMDVMAGMGWNPAFVSVGNANEEDDFWRAGGQPEFWNSGQDIYTRDWEVPLLEEKFAAFCKWLRFGPVGKCTNLTVMRNLHTREVLKEHAWKYVFAIHHYAFFRGGGGPMNIDQYYNSDAEADAVMKWIVASLLRENLLGGWALEDTSGPSQLDINPGDTDIDPGDPDAAIQTGRITRLLRLGRAARRYGGIVGWDAASPRRPGSAENGLASLDQATRIIRPRTWAEPLFSTINPGAY